MGKFCLSMGSAMSFVILMYSHALVLTRVVLYTYTHSGVVKGVPMQQNQVPEAILCLLPQQHSLLGRLCVHRLL